METKMLRWTAEVTRMDSIRNGVIRQKFDVAPVFDKMREARLRWCSHVLCGEDDSVSKIGLNFEMQITTPSFGDNARLQLQKQLGKMSRIDFFAVWMTTSPQLCDWA
ncbi:unnamed protein product [Heligmosomoides polygyrus]|uniref:Uncharacterized protein n=1 Tax=Heligmosomoides polygyrus TaxID=6339 RepID=A0A183G2N7_HELPZ|nr:unnamed protein product [Heligmosomoides polygyrus]